MMLRSGKVGIWSVATLLAGSAVVLAACGASTTSTTAVARARSSRRSSSAASTATPGGQPTTSSQSTGTPPAPTAAQVQMADTINLQASDFPAGWTSLGSTSSAGTAQTSQAVSSCPGVHRQELTSFVPSPGFTQEAAGVSPAATPIPAEIGSLVGFATSPSVARQAVAYVGSSAGAACIQAVVDRAVAAAGSGSPVHYGDVSVTSAAQQLDGAPGAVVSIHFTLQLSSAGVNEPFDETLDVFAEQSTVVEMFTVDLPAADSQLADQLLAGLVRRA